MQARLNMLLGPDAYDSLFLGLEFGELKRGTIDAWVSSQYCICEIEPHHLALLASVVGNVLRRPVHRVNLLPRDWSPSDHY